MEGATPTSLSRLSSKLSLFLRALRMNSAMGLLLLPSWLRLKVPSLFSFLHACVSFSIYCHCLCYSKDGHNKSLWGSAHDGWHGGEHQARVQLLPHRSHCLNNLQAPTCREQIEFPS